MYSVIYFIVMEFLTQLFDAIGFLIFSWFKVSLEDNKYYNNLTWHNVYSLQFLCNIAD